MLCSPFKDKHGKDIYAEDVVELVNMDNEKVLAVCRYGVARRKMDGGDEVDIPGFHFELEDGRKTFPIVNNYAGKHDLELFEIIGHTFK
jgi:hypothetical protein